MKTCNDCKIEKPLSDFYKNKATSDGLTYYCKPCQATKTSKSPNQKSNVRKAQLKRLYGTTPEHYDELLAKQKGVCAICFEPEKGKREYLCIDHDHKTGYIRGLLCHDCNLGIGKLKDSQELLKSAIWYLDKADSLMKQEIEKILLK